MSEIKKRVTFVWHIYISGVRHQREIAMIVPRLPNQLWERLLYRDRKLREVYGQDARITVTNKVRPSHIVDLDDRRGQHGIAKPIYKQLITDAVPTCPHCGGKLE